MKCSVCNWTNPSHFEYCFECKNPLKTNHSSLFPEVVQTTKETVQETKTVFLATTLTRILATLVDLLLMMIGLFVFIFFLIDGVFQSTKTVIPAFIIIFYHPAILDKLGGSIGKRLFKIQIVNSKAEMPSLFRLLLRHTIKYVANLCFPFVWIVFSHLIFGKRNAHDSITNTYVVQCHSLPNESNKLQEHEILLQQTKPNSSLIIEFVSANKRQT